METHKIYVCCGQPQLADQFLGDRPERSAQHETNKNGACQRSVIVEGKACTFALWWPDGTESEVLEAASSAGVAAGGGSEVELSLQPTQQAIILWGVPSLEIV